MIALYGMAPEDSNLQPLIVVSYSIRLSYGQVKYGGERGLTSIQVLARIIA